MSRKPNTRYLLKVIIPITINYHSTLRMTDSISPAGCPPITTLLALFFFIELASSSARVEMWSKCRCSGVSNPIRIPERRAAGWVWGRFPPNCAGSSRWVPSLEGLGLAKTTRCLPRHVVRVVGAPTRFPWFLLAPEPQVASGCGATDVPQGCMAAWCSPGTSTIGFGLGRVRRGALVT